jgi:hypothetical protein
MIQIEYGACIQSNNEEEVGCSSGGTYEGHRAKENKAGPESYHSPFLILTSAILRAGGYGLVLEHLLSMCWVKSQPTNQTNKKISTVYYHNT